MKNIKIISFFMFVLVLTYQTVSADNSKAYEIMEKVEDRDRGDNMISNMEMILNDKWDKQRVKCFTSQAILQKITILEIMIVCFLMLSIVFKIQNPKE